MTIFFQIVYLVKLEEWPTSLVDMRMRPVSLMNQAYCLCLELHLFLDECFYIASFDRCCVYNSTLLSLNCVCAGAMLHDAMLHDGRMNN